MGRKIVMPDEEHDEQQDQEQQQQWQPVPDDHPLAKALDAQKAEIAALKKTARDNAKSLQRLSELEDAQKTDEQRTADKIAKLQTASDTAAQDALRFKIALRNGMSEEDAELFLTGHDEDTLQKQAERLKARETQQRSGWSSGEGRSDQLHGDPKLAFAQELFNNTK